MERIQEEEPPRIVKSEGNKSYSQTLFKTLQERRKKEKDEKYRALLNGSKPKENSAFARYRNASTNFQNIGIILR